MIEDLDHFLIHLHGNVDANQWIYVVGFWIGHLVEFSFIYKLDLLEQKRDVECLPGSSSLSASTPSTGT